MSRKSIALTSFVALGTATLALTMVSGIALAQQLSKNPCDNPWPYNSGCNAAPTPDARVKATRLIWTNPLAIKEAKETDAPKQPVLVDPNAKEAVTPPPAKNQRQAPGKAQAPAKAQAPVAPAPAAAPAPAPAPAPKAAPVQQAQTNPFAPAQAAEAEVAPKPAPATPRILQRVPPKAPVVAQTEPVPTPAPAPRQQVAMVTAPKGVVEPKDVKPVATEVLRDCLHCPEMVKLAAGTFIMGSNNDRSERPVRSVAVAPFALGRYPVTVGEWKFCVAAKVCSYEPTGADDQPVRNISWNDAQQYVGWLSKVTKQNYRLPTEAEWEYAARANTTTPYWWGAQMVDGMANCKGCGGAYDASQPLKVGSFKANAFGLYDMTGGVAQWVADCWHPDYQGAPSTGAAREKPSCQNRTLRGGSWKNDPTNVKVSTRDQYDAGVRYLTHGLRVARAP